MEKRTPSEITDFLEEMGGTVLVAAWDRPELEEAFHRLAVASPAAELWRDGTALLIKPHRGRICGLLPNVRFGIPRHFDLVVWTRAGHYPDLFLDELIQRSMTRIARSVLLA